jgi:hypothetical protein
MKKKVILFRIEFVVIFYRSISPVIPNAGTANPITSFANLVNAIFVP